MAQNVLFLAIVVAVIVSGATVVWTGSILFAVLAYMGAGMAVLLALLLSDMIFGPAPTEELSEAAYAPVDTRG